MKLSPIAFCPFVVLLAACGETSRPAGQTSNNDVPLVDVPAIDSVVPSDLGNDATVGDADASADSTSPDTPPVTDGGSDAATDAPVADRADVQVMIPGLCAWSHGDLAAFATRLGMCTFRPPQAALNEYFNPVNWEGGPLSARACGALRCVADVTTAGTCSSWLSSCLKYEVSRVAGGTCAAPTASCDGTGSGTYRSCVSGVETRDNCTALGLRCVATGGEAACVTAMGAACPAGSPPRCNGNVLEQCVLGVYTRVRNCDLTGGVCDATANTCRGTGAECTGDATSCDGTQLRVCRGGRWHAVDCGRLVTGATCQTVNSHSFCGIDHECDPLAAAPGGTCDGSTLVLCAAGRTYRYVCEPRNGFTSCVNGTGCMP